MGLFDRFRKRVQEVAEETDGDALSVDAASEEGKALVDQPTVSQVEDHEEDWDDVDDETVSTPCCNHIEVLESASYRPKDGASVDGLDPEVESVG